MSEKPVTNQIKELWNDNSVNSNNAAFKDSKFLKLIDILKSTSFGKEFTYVMNPKTGNFDFLSDEIYEVLGYQKDEFSFDYYISLVHPEDLPFILEIQHKVADFCLQNIPKDRMDYKYCNDFRIRHQNGEYIQVYLQYFYLEMSEDYQAMRVMSILSDISHIKIGGEPKLSVFKLSEGLVNILNEKRESRITLSNKENEIFEFMVKGFTSQDIGEALGISKHTVDTHRRNILKRNHCSNTSELLNLYFDRA